MCDWSNCRSEGQITYAAVRPAFDLCDAHWEKFCELEGVAKMKAIHRIVPTAVSKALVEQALRKEAPKRTERSPERRGSTQLMMFN